MKFVTQVVQGHEGLVRGLFAGRDLGAPAARSTFPGVHGVAIMPRQFDDERSAREWLQATAQQGGNAVAAKFGSERWLIGAWIE